MCSQSVKAIPIGVLTSTGLFQFNLVELGQAKVNHKGSLEQDAGYKPLAAENMAWFVQFFQR